MYDLKNLNIWKETSSNDIFRYKDKVLKVDGFNGRENIMTDKCQTVFDEILRLVPSARIREIKEMNGGKLKFPIYMKESLKETGIDVLELSVRSSNCLHRAGFNTIWDLVDTIETMDDLRKIRNCGSKSVNEIMEQLFCYQYCQLDATQKIRYINKVLELN